MEAMLCHGVMLPPKKTRCFRLWEEGREAETKFWLILRVLVPLYNQISFLNLNCPFDEGSTCEAYVGTNTKNCAELDNIGQVEFGSICWIRFNMLNSDQYVEFGSICIPQPKPKVKLGGWCDGHAWWWWLMKLLLLRTDGHRVAAIWRLWRE